LIKASTVTNEEEKLNISSVPTDVSQVVEDNNNLQQLHDEEEK
jgi:hypothetical protein